MMSEHHANLYHDQHVSKVLNHLYDQWHVAQYEPLIAKRSLMKIQTEDDIAMQVLWIL